ncbi:multidrug resistance efflux pump [Ochrobactrum daejeonense]|uniref:Multidrug resistance efflux pump n=1 Tax=Brucella daejeonensis TaxID=659015 RepID=A0A7W9B0M5_9HYPH|nr:multidrug resistance efflux pump [Brucella daejeonensis]NKB79910.1 biotin/lipoyl-binding protein [Brucella daejeonensis]
MSTDNAYVQADILGVSTDVSGLVASIDVQENESVNAGQVLFTLKPAPFRIALEGAPIAEDTAIIEAGLDLGITDSAALGLSYSGQQHGVNARFAISF